MNSAKERGCQSTGGSSETSTRTCPVGGRSVGSRSYFDVRVGGESKRHHDRYWYSPKEKIKLRSIVEIRKFMKSLKESKGDELKAKSIYKSIQLLRISII
jgi:uncharacterized protein (DUF427 family)